MEEVKIFTLKEHLDLLEAAYSIGAVKSVSKNDKEELITSLKKAVIKHAEVTIIKLKANGKDDF